MHTTTEIAQNKRHRSPAYPSVDLETAVQKVALLYEGIKKNPTHVETAISTMEYKSGSSTGIRAVAAMISYGLLEEEGAGNQRKVRLTKSAIDLQLLDENDLDRLEILQRMAIRPKIFDEIINRYPGDLPNDATIEKYLKVDKDFNPDVVRPLIRNFRSTYQYANLSNLDTLSEHNDETDICQESFDDHEDQAKLNVVGQRKQSSVLADAPSQAQDRNVKINNQEDMRTLTIPLPRERIAFLDIPAHSSAEDFRFMLKYLELTRDAWVGRPDSPAHARTAPKIQFGNATWNRAETDSPVTVIGYWGERDGRHYVEIEGSNTGVPLDEITYAEI